jgi:diaminopimelate decarboxylase
MRGVTITDRNDEGTLAVDLIDILKVLGPEVDNAVWELSNVESVGNSADQMHKLSDDRGRISGKVLRNLADNLQQVIDGVFKAYRTDGGPSWVTIRAVDSSAYDVESEDEDVISRIRNSFTNVDDIP